VTVCVCLCLCVSLSVHLIILDISLYSIYISVSISDSVHSVYVPSFLSISNANLSSSVKRSVQSTPVLVLAFRAQYASEASLASVAAYFFVTSS
jgi:hypothetical protein